MISNIDNKLGKKRNEARNRNEPTEYSLDQLLVGAMLFTLAAFLLPTVLAYYLVFALVSDFEAKLHEADCAGFTGEDRSHLLTR